MSEPGGQEHPETSASAEWAPGFHLLRLPHCITEADLVTFFNDISLQKHMQKENNVFDQLIFNLVDAF